MRARRLSRAKRNVARRARRGLPAWCKFPWRKLPQRWHAWKDYLTAEECDFLVSAVYEDVRHTKAMAIDRIEMPWLTYLKKQA